MLFPCCRLPSLRSLHLILQKLAERQCFPQWGFICWGIFFNCTTANLYIREPTVHVNIWHTTPLHRVFAVFSEQYCHNRTVTVSINSLLVSYLSRPFGGESGDRVSSGVPPLCSSSHPSLILSARHVDAWLFGLKVLYLSSPPWQPVAPVPGSAHTRPALSCLTCLAVKDDLQTCLPMSARVE